MADCPECGSLLKREVTRNRSGELYGRGVGSSQGARIVRICSNDDCNYSSNS